MINRIKANKYRFKVYEVYTETFINRMNGFLKTLFKASVKISKRIDNFIPLVWEIFV